MSEIYDITLEYGNEANQYCTPTDVARILQYNLPTGFTTETSPTLYDIKEMIYLAMDEIDRETGHAWRERQITEYEYHNIDNYHMRATGIPVHLMYREIKQLDASRDDTIEIWNGANWENYLTDRTEGRNRDYWLDYKLGTLYLRSWLWLERPIGIRLKYRYGEDVVPSAIRNVCSKMVALNILYGEDRSVLLPENSSNIDYLNKTSLLQRDIEKTLNNYKEWHVVDVRG